MSKRPSLTPPDRTHPGKMSSPSLSSGRKKGEALTSKRSSIASGGATASRSRPRPTSSSTKKKLHRNLSSTKRKGSRNSEERKQMLIRKFLETESAAEEKSQANLKEVSCSKLSKVDESKEKVDNEVETTKSNISTTFTEKRPSSMQPSITLTRERDSKSDGSLDKEVIEETIHYFNTPSGSEIDLRPHSAPIGEKLPSGDNGYARFLLDKIHTRSLHFEPQMKKIREASLTSYERTVVNKTLTMDHQLDAPLTQVTSDYNQILPRIHSAENAKHPESQLIKPAQQSSTKDEEKLVSLMPKEGDLQGRQDGDLQGRQDGDPKPRSASLKMEDQNAPQNSSHFPAISTAPTKKKGVGAFNMSLRENFQEANESESLTNLMGLKEAWSMPAISKPLFPLKSDDDKLTMDADGFSESSLSSHGLGQKTEGHMKSSKETENLGRQSKTPSTGKRKKGSGRNEVDSPASDGQFLPHVRGANSSTPTSGENSTKNSKPNSPRLQSLPDSGGLTFTGTFDGTATVQSSSREQSGLFGYDFSVLPTSSVSPSPPSSSASSLEYKNELKAPERPKSRSRRRHHAAKPTVIEMEDLEFPAVKATRPKTALGSSRSVSTKQVAFEVSETDDPTSYSDSTVRKEHTISISHEHKEEQYSSCPPPSQLNSPNNISPAAPKTRQESATFLATSKGPHTSHRPNSGYYSYRPKPGSMEPHSSYRTKSASKELVQSQRPKTCSSRRSGNETVVAVPKYHYPTSSIRGHTDALSMPSRDYIDHFSQLQVWKQERMIREIHKEITRRYGKHVYFVHPSREFMLSIFNKSVTTAWSFSDVFREVEDYWIKPILNWHRRMYIYSLVYPPNE